ncbi:MAG: aryl-sulfate sulfotransferase, partial [Deltaproteobacteria bacterium]|nr:aryl-sulfate sulfotransferase [Deltaproteobacteria bacterium]
HTDTVYIVDKKTGKVKWRWGNLAYLDKETGQIEYKRRTAKDTLGGQHCAHEIPSNLPGGGNILIYDNGMYADGSRAVEVDPKTSKVVWETPSPRNRGHFSRYISGAERLPNGNTLITSGEHGRLFEVTKDFEIVWEYIHTMPHIFRSHRYAQDFAPQFRNLPPAKGPAVPYVSPSGFKMPIAGPSLTMPAKGRNRYQK